MQSTYKDSKMKQQLEMVFKKKQEVKLEKFPTKKLFRDNPKIQDACLRLLELTTKILGLVFFLFSAYALTRDGFPRNQTDIFEDIDVNIICLEVGNNDTDSSDGNNEPLGNFYASVLIVLIFEVMLFYLPIAMMRYIDDNTISGMIQKLKSSSGDSFNMSKIVERFVLNKRECHYIGKLYLCVHFQNVSVSISAMLFMKLLFRAAAILVLGVDQPQFFDMTNKDYENAVSLFFPSFLTCNDDICGQGMRSFCHSMMNVIWADFFLIIFVWFYCLILINIIRVAWDLTMCVSLYMRELNFRCKVPDLSEADARNLAHFLNYDEYIFVGFVFQNMHSDFKGPFAKALTNALDGRESTAGDCCISIDPEITVVKA